MALAAFAIRMRYFSFGMALPSKQLAISLATVRRKPPVLIYASQSRTYVMSPCLCQWKLRCAHEPHTRLFIRLGSDDHQLSRLEIRTGTALQEPDHRSEIT